MQTALNYWRSALAIRNEYAIDGVPIPKRPIPPKCESFRNATEFTTLEELNQIMLDLDALRMQSLLICERILGSHHKDTLFRLMYRGASYADAFRYYIRFFFQRKKMFFRLMDSKLYAKYYVYDCY